MALDTRGFRFLEGIADRLEDIKGQLEVHLQADPLADIIESALESLNGVLEEINEELL